MGMGMGSGDGDGDEAVGRPLPSSAGGGGGSSGLAVRHLRHPVPAGAAGSERRQSPPAARTLFAGPFHNGGKGN